MKAVRWCTGIMDIYFLRHASAGQRKAFDADDEKRALDKEGLEQAKSMGYVLSKLEVQFNAILSSPLKRAMQTAELVQKAIKGAPSVKVEETLRPEALFEEFRRMLHRYREKDTVMVVGHNPNLSEFLSAIIGGDEARDLIDLRKGALAKVDYDQRQGSLHWCLTPKVVAQIQATPATKSRPKTSRK